MQSLTQNVFKGQSKKYKILTFPTHEGYQSLLDKTGHEFYMLTGPNLKGWDYHTRPLPPNHYLIKTPWNETKVFEDIDFVLVQSRDFQFDIGNSIAQQHQIPVIQIDHTQPPKNANNKQISQLSKRSNQHHVYITNFSKNSWNDPNGMVIPHGIDTNVFKPSSRVFAERFPAGMSLVNQFASRDIFCGWEIWKQLASQCPIQLFGENPGISNSLNNVDQLCEAFNNYRCFVNTSQWSPVPLSLLEAMACGLPVVTTSKQEIPNIIQNAYNGYISNDLDILRDMIHYLINNPEKAEEMGKNARQTIIEHFSIERFVENWNNLFDKVMKEKR
jgi:glycosyltransferase involved in cell wall biosynthesis